jgi:hypothetical protein
MERCCAALNGVLSNEGFDVREKLTWFGGHFSQVWGRRACPWREDRVTLIYNPSESQVTPSVSVSIVTPDRLREIDVMSLRYLSDPPKSRFCFRREADPAMEEIQARISASVKHAVSGAPGGFDQLREVTEATSQDLLNLPKSAFTPQVDETMNEIAEKMRSHGLLWFEQVAGSLPATLDHLRRTDRNGFPVGSKVHADIVAFLEGLI